MSFLHNVTPKELSILYNGERFESITKYSLKSSDIEYYKNFSRACEIAMILAFHHALIHFVQKPEIRSVNISFHRYSPPNWDQLVSYTLENEDSLKRQEKSALKKEWELICRRGFPYKKTPDNYTKVFGSMIEMPLEVNMKKKLKSYRADRMEEYLFYFEIDKNNIDTYLKFLLGEDHYKFYYMSTENFLLKKGFINNSSNDNYLQSEKKKNRL